VAHFAVAGDVDFAVAGWKATARFSGGGETFGK
jgi:hypothetical protein